MSATDVQRSLAADRIPGILAAYPGITWRLEGEGREREESMLGLGRGIATIPLPLIYALLAIPFRSYLQPLIVMSAIPFGIIWAVWGHVLLGMPLSMMSLFGLVALSGVVVNDSLVLVDFINRDRREGKSLEEAIREAGVIRFRPIWLTSITTFAGVMPIILERSVQAQFLIPMAVSLGFGVMFSTFTTLVQIPASYAILEDLRRLFSGPEVRTEKAAAAGAGPAL